jgi:2-oxoglutarate/2-oxoacid ferredoxin oxidoreductase subunit alpha
MQARWGTHGDHELIVLAPSSVSECFTETVRAFNLSERYRVPVILLSDEIVGHMREGVAYPDSLPIVNRRLPEKGLFDYRPFRGDPDGVPEIANLGSGYRFHVTGLIHDETGFPSNDPNVIRNLLCRLQSKIIDHLDDIVEYDAESLDDAEIGVVSFGSTARSAHRAVRLARDKGIKAGYLKLRTIWPFPDELIRSLGERMILLVPEMNLGQLVREVARASRGRVVPYNRVDGEMITPDEILAALEGI